MPKKRYRKVNFENFIETYNKNLMKGFWEEYNRSVEAEKIKKAKKANKGKGKSLAKYYKPTKKIRTSVKVAGAGLLGVSAYHIGKNIKNKKTKTRRKKNAR